MRRALIAIALLLALAACNDHDAGGKLQELHKDSFEAIVGTWPLTVDSATPVCGEYPGAVGVKVGGTIYALNGTAETHEHWADIAPIWSDSNDPGPKVPIGDLLNYVAERC